MSDAADVALAGAAISLVTLDTLVRKGILDRGNGMLILETAAKRCEPHSAAAAQLCMDAHAQMLRGH